LSGSTLKVHALTSRPPRRTATLPSVARATWYSSGGAAPAGRGDGGFRRRDRLLNVAAGADHVEIARPAGANRDDASRRHRIDGAGGPGRFAGQEDRRPRGVGGRGYPCVDPGDGGRRRLTAAKGFAKALDSFGAGGDEADDEEESDQVTQRKRVAGVETRGGNAGAEIAEGGEQASPVRQPQGLSGGVVGAVASRSVNEVAGRCGAPVACSTREKAAARLGAAKRTARQTR
jgi:hypothetical protein